MIYLLTMLMNLFGFLTAPILFPIAYLLRSVSVFRNHILWVYYDDEDEFGYDVYWFKPHLRNGFKKAYLWCAIRNPAWNLHTLSMLKGPAVDYVFLKPKGILQKNSEILKPNLYSIAGLKYEDDYGSYLDNKGPILSLKYSIIGSQFVRFYNIKTGKKYWRYSYANRLIDNIWIEFQIGYSTRATFRLKIKKIKKSKLWIG